MGVVLSKAIKLKKTKVLPKRTDKVVTIKDLVKPGEPEAKQEKAPKKSKKTEKKEPLDNV